MPGTQSQANPSRSKALKSRKESKTSKFSKLKTEMKRINAVLTANIVTMWWELRPAPVPWWFLNNQVSFFPKSATVFGLHTLPENTFSKGFTWRTGKPLTAWVCCVGQYILTWTLESHCGVFVMAWAISMTLLSETLSIISQVTPWRTEFSFLCQKQMFEIKLNVAFVDKWAEMVELCVSLKVKLLEIKHLLCQVSCLYNRQKNIQHFSNVNGLDI